MGIVPGMLGRGRSILVLRGRYDSGLAPIWCGLGAGGRTSGGCGLLHRRRLLPMVAGLFLGLGVRLCQRPGGVFGCRLRLSSVVF